MKKLKILNSREIKKFKEVLKKEYGYPLQKDYAYLVNDKNRLFIINKDLSKLDTKDLIIDRVGLYFAEYKNQQIQ